MTHVMLDLETFGNGSDALIVSIGACKFDPCGSGVTDSFHVAIDPVSAQAIGLKIDAGTVMWWLHADRAPAREALLANEMVDIGSALSGFAEWFGGTSMPVWGNGATFDNVILRHAFQRYGLPCPWHFGHDRCYRTMKNLAPHVLIERTGTHHDALDDAVSQALHLQVIGKYLELEYMG
jgi:exodeoxyribonuclease VIII